MGDWRTPTVAGRTNRILTNHTAVVYGARYGRGTSGEEAGRESSTVRRAFWGDRVKRKLEIDAETTASMSAAELRDAIDSLGFGIPLGKVRVKARRRGGFNHRIDVLVFEIEETEAQRVDRAKYDPEGRLGEQIS